MAAKDVSLLPVSAPEPSKGSTLIAAISVLSKSIVGVGILNLSINFHNIGFISGVIVLIFAALLAGFTLHLLSAVTIRMNMKDVSFYSVACRIFPGAKNAVDLLIFVKCIGVGSVYIIVASQLLSKMIPKPSFCPDEQQWRSICALISIAFAIPYSIPKRVRTLKIPNLIALCCLLLACLVFFGALISQSPIDAESRGDQRVPNVDREWLFKIAPFGELMKELISALPVFIFAFTCHQNMLPIANELRDRTLNKLNIVIITSLIVAGVLYMICALSGFILMGSHATNNILTALNTHYSSGFMGLLLRLSSFALWVGMVLSFPIQCNPGRSSIMNVIFCGRELERSVYRKRMHVVTACFVLMCGSVSYFTEDLGLTMKLVGAVGSNALCYLLPAAMYLGMFHSKSAVSEREVGILVEEEEEEADWKKEPELVEPPRWKYLSAWFILGFGVVFMPLSLFVVLNEKMNWV